MLDIFEKYPEAKPFADLLPDEPNDREETARQIAERLKTAPPQVHGAVAVGDHPLAISPEKLADREALEAQMETSAKDGNRAKWFEARRRLAREHGVKFGE